jgi:hypothetical protein
MEANSSQLDGPLKGAGGYIYIYIRSHFGSRHPMP